MKQAKLSPWRQAQRAARRNRRILLLGLAGLMLFGLTAAQFVYTLSAGDSLLVNCPNPVAVTQASTQSANVVCEANTRTPTPVPPTATIAPPTATPGNGLPLVDPVILGSCTAAIHDRYTVVGPDGKLYRTWHPQVVPIDPANPGAGNCVFAHEHGDNPSLSAANSTLPAFGYIGDLAGFPEPHEGFKVFVINAGYTVDDGGVVQANTRAVVHMGTSGAGRFDTQLHSMSFDLTAPDGHYVHVQGMGDTGSVGNICQANRQGKTVQQLPGTGCDTTSLYEIWSMTLTIADANGNGAQAVFAPSAFDPISLFNPADVPGHRVLYLTDNYFTGSHRGCKREGYAGPVYWRNPFAQTTFLTDAFGAIGKGRVVQKISTSASLGIRMTTTNFYQAKESRNFCAAGLGLKN